MPCCASRAWRAEHLATACTPRLPRRRLLALGGAGLLAGTAGRAAAAGSRDEMVVQVDAAAAPRPISPLIYGLNWADATALRELNVPLNRQGGNNCSRYHWKENAHAAGSDWYFQSLPSEGGAEPGARVHRFVTAARQNGAEAMVTIPMIDWLASLGPRHTKRASFSQARYGEQTGHDSAWFPDAGNGILRATGQPVTGNDPADAGSPNSPALQREWVQRLVARHGEARRGGVRWYLLDNEPSLWHNTHRDVQPLGLSMDGLLRRSIDYARAVKSADPSALVAGPEEWGWGGLFYSGQDQQWRRRNDWREDAPDRSAHGGQDYLPWWLAQMRSASDKHGQRLLDVLSLHFYPEGGEHGDDVSPAMQRLRNRSTRALWDPDYVDTSWIRERVQLIPRLRAWVAEHFPGLQLALTEYSWGADAHINGATAQADLLGIFGREGLDLAARWEAPARGSPTWQAIKLYRNPDGRRLGFGDRSLPAPSPDADRLASFAALRSADGALTVMLVHKALDTAARVRLRLGAWRTTPGPFQGWQLAADSSTGRQAAIRAFNSATATDSDASGDLLLTLPPQTVTLLVLPAGG